MIETHMTDSEIKEMTAMICESADHRYLSARQRRGLNIAIKLPTVPITRTGKPITTTKHRTDLEEVWRDDRPTVHAGVRATGTSQ
jgi:hypothetical protein